MKLPVAGHPNLSEKKEEKEEGRKEKTCHHVIGQIQQKLGHKQ